MRKVTRMPRNIHIVGPSERPPPRRPKTLLPAEMPVHCWSGNLESLSGADPRQPVGVGRDAERRRGARYGLIELIGHCEGEQEGRARPPAAVEGVRVPSAGASGDAKRGAEAGPRARDGG